MMMAKLSTFVVRRDLVAWLDSFLHDRLIAEIIDESISEFIDAIAGDPQGSALSPTFFMLYVNNLLSFSACLIHAFANNTTLRHSLFYSSLQTANLPRP